jgi:hypothetical protein
MIAPDRHWHDASRLMQSRQIPREGHARLQENLATYLAHRDDEDQLSPRWQQKLDRDLAHPYNDQQVSVRIDQLQESLRENLLQLGEYPSQIYLTGSFARARLGGNSDLDGLVMIEEGGLNFAFDVLEERIEKQDAAALVPIPADNPGLLQAQLMAQGASVQIDVERLQTPGYLRQVYQHVQEQRPQRRETSPLFEAITERVWSEDLGAAGKRELLAGHSLKAVTLRHLMSTGGQISQAPVVGPIVVEAVDQVVEQNHLAAP